MRRYHKRPEALLYCIALFFLFNLDALTAQRPGPADTVHLSLTDAVTRALRESEEMAAVRAQVDQAESQVTQALAVALPQLSTNVTYNRAIKTIFDVAAAPPPMDSSQIPDAFDLGRTPEDRFDILSSLMTQNFVSGLFQGLPFGRKNTYIATVQLSQILWSGGSVGAGLDAARRVRTSSGYQLDEAQADLTLQVRTAYLNAVLAQHLHEIALDSREVADAHLQQVEAFFEAGTTSEFELLRAQVDRENRDLPVVQAANAAELAMLELKRLVNIPAHQPLVLDTELEPQMVEMDEAELAQHVDNRPALYAAREMVIAREDAVKVYRGQRLPSVMLMGNLGFQGFPETVAPPGFGDWREDWSVSLAISWNPFDGFRTRGQIAQAQAELRQAHVQQTQLEEALTLETAAAMAEYRAAESQIRARRETVELAERTLNLAEVRFANGMATQLEVSDAALLLDQARVNEVQAEHDYLRALAHLERLSGGQLQLLRFP